jgi:pseudouridine-5'-phosphate glycosidase
VPAVIRLKGSDSSLPTHDVFLPNRSGVIRVLPHIARAIESGIPAVALESSVLAQGLPIPENREAARRMVAAVEVGGAVAGITAVVHGTPTVGLREDELERFLARDGIKKVSARDLPGAMVQRRDGATTVAASVVLAHAAGIQVFATGGIGGVHREAPFDESADLAELARTPIVVVCAGAKSILDLSATWERLETLGIPVVGFRTSELPGFFTAETGIRLDTRVDNASDVAAVFRAHRSLGRPQALLVVQAPPADHRLPRDTVEQAVAAAQQTVVERGIRGADVTPILLSAVTRLTGGSSLAANLALLEQNAALAAEITVALGGERE